MSYPGRRAHRVPAAARFDAVADVLQSAREGSGHPAQRVRAAGHAAAPGGRRPAPVVFGGLTQHRGQLPCREHDPDLWFAEDPDDLELAKALCGECPVRQACLAGACDRMEPTGVWGGQIFDGGRIVTQKRRRGRPRKSFAVSEPERSSVACCA